MPATDLMLIQVLGLACALCAIYLTFRIGTRISAGGRLSLPPGPKGYPVIGNLLDMPARTTQNWKKYAEWGEQYGGICSARVFGQTFIILNDQQVVHELLDARGATYSDRPQTVTLRLGGFTRSTTLMPYNDEWKEHRKLLAHAMGTPQLTRKFHPIAEHQSLMFLQRLIKDPRDIVEAIKTSTGSATLSLAYGYSIDEEGDDPLIDVIDRITAMFGEAQIPGRFLVDTLPFLQYLPRWIPGIKDFKSFIAEARMYSERKVNLPMKFIREEMARDRRSTCYVSDLLSDQVDENTMKNIAYTAANFYGAGTDTMKVVVLNYFLAMSISPQIQERLHNEVDAVVGRKRLPTLQDRNSLPYLQAVFKECFRWLPALPTGVLHRTSSDDIYQGYAIPKGSIVVVNAWKLLHDPDTYSDPFTFKPERFLGSSPEKDPYSYCFGFGRRICPGMHLGDAVVWTFLARAAAALHISKFVGPDGKEMEPTCDQTPGVVSQPMPFRCRITPRHDQAALLIDEGLLGGS